MQMTWCVAWMMGARLWMMCVSCAVGVSVSGFKRCGSVFVAVFFFSRLLRTRRFLKVTSLALGGSLDAFEGCAVLFTKTLGCGASVW